MAAMDAWAVSSCLVATSTARRKLEVKASGHGSVDGRRRALGPRPLPGTVKFRGWRRERLGAWSTSRYVGKVMMCRAPGLLAAGGTAKGEMPQPEPCQCDSMTGARPNRARRLVG